MRLTDLFKVSRLMNAQAVGTTTINGSILDTQGYEGVALILFAGTITDGDFDLKAQQGNDAGLSDAADLAGSKVSLAVADDNKCAVLDLGRVTKRYIRPVVVRGGVTGGVIDGVVAVQYGPSNAAVIHDATVAASETHGSPAEGVA